MVSAGIPAISARPMDTRYNLRTDDLMLDRLYDVQQKPELRYAKVCVHRDDDRRDQVTVEGDLPFSPTMTQLEELELLVSRTVRAAARLQQELGMTS